MQEEHKKLPTPHTFQSKLLKGATLIIFFLVLLVLLSFVGVETTSTSTFCSSCHEMKPEYYTWKASTHSEVDCVSCHIEPGAQNLVKAKADGLKELYKTVTDSYISPIIMPREIPDAACESCHNMSKRKVTPTGDLIIPHEKHIEKRVACVQCHSGVAHGKIATRKITYNTDYGRWDADLGRSVMNDIKYTNPTMETCIDCHKARKASVKCETCHTTGMLPDSHLDEKFKLKSHGQEARKDVEECHTCHGYMSDKKIDGFDETPSYMHYIDSEKKMNRPMTVSKYAKENTFCKDCHSERPASHTKLFASSHGKLASVQQETCATCHSYQKTSDSVATTIACASCHPSSHKNNVWRVRHPIPLAVNQKLTKTCYQCHSVNTCSNCHRGSDN